MNYSFAMIKVFNKYSMINKKCYGILHWSSIGRNLIKSSLFLPITIPQRFCLKTYFHEVNVMSPKLLIFGP